MWVFYSALALQQTEADPFFKVPFRAEQVWCCSEQGKSTVMVCRAPKKQGSSRQSAVTDKHGRKDALWKNGQKAKNEPFIYNI